MGVINKQDFGITCNVVKALSYKWKEEFTGLKKLSERRREVSCLEAGVLIGFG